MVAASLQYINSYHPMESRFKRDMRFLTKMVEDETKMVGEVLRIKAILDKNPDDQWVLYESLSKLRDMRLSVKILKATGIGRSVSVLQNHASMDVLQTARMLIKAWRHLVDECINAIEDESNNHHRVSEKEYVDQMGPVTPELINVKNRRQAKAGVCSQGVAEVLRMKQILDHKSNEDESGAVVCDLLTKLQGMGLSVKTLEMTGIGKSVRLLQKHASNDVRQIAGTLIKAWKAMANQWFDATESRKKIAPTCKQPQPKIVIRMKLMKTERKSGVSETPKAPVAPAQQRKTMTAEEEEEKIKATKRKLQQGYEKVENNKRQRKIRVMELHEVMKQGLLPQRQPVNQNRKR